MREYKYITVPDRELARGIYLDREKGLWVPEPDKVFAWDGGSRWSEVVGERRGNMVCEVVLAGDLTGFPGVGSEWI